MATDPYPPRLAGFVLALATIALFYWLGWDRVGLRWLRWTITAALVVTAVVFWVRRRR
jgi:hypothetical protein